MLGECSVVVSLFALGELKHPIIAECTSAWGSELGISSLYVAVTLRGVDNVQEILTGHLTLICYEVGMSFSNLKINGWVHGSSGHSQHL